MKDKERIVENKILGEGEWLLGPKCIYMHSAFIQGVLVSYNTKRLFGVKIEVLPSH